MARGDKTNSSKAVSAWRKGTASKAERGDRKAEWGASLDHTTLVLTLVPPQKMFHIKNLVLGKQLSGFKLQTKSNLILHCRTNYRVTLVYSCQTKHPMNYGKEQNIFLEKQLMTSQHSQRLRSSTG